MTSRRAQDWIDAFFNSIEVGASIAANHAKAQKTAGKKVAIMGFDIEAYRHRSEVWRRVRKELMLFGFDVEEVDFRGVELMPNSNTQLRFNNPQRWLELYHTSEAKQPIRFTGDDAVCVQHFLEFYLEAYHKGIDPREYTKQVLIHQGVTKENFAQHKDKLLITNPWED